MLDFFSGVCYYNIVKGERVMKTIKLQYDFYNTLKTEYFFTISEMAQFCYEMGKKYGVNFGVICAKNIE